MYVRPVQCTDLCQHLEVHRAGNQGQSKTAAPGWKCGDGK